MMLIKLFLFFLVLLILPDMYIYISGNISSTRKNRNNFISIIIYSFFIDWRRETF